MAIKIDDAAYCRFCKNRTDCDMRVETIFNRGCYLFIFDEKYMY